MMRPSLLAEAWHDVTCDGCQDRRAHATAKPFDGIQRQPMILREFVARCAELEAWQSEGLREPRYWNPA